jgi:hypothetical protein
MLWCGNLDSNQDDAFACEGKCYLTQVRMCQKRHPVTCPGLVKAVID